MLLNKRVSSLLLVIFYFTQFSNGIIIETSLGKLRGYNVSTNVNRTVHIFKVRTSIRSSLSYKPYSAILESTLRYSAHR